MGLARVSRAPPTGRGARAGSTRAAAGLNLRRPGRFAALLAVARRPDLLAPPPTPPYPRSSLHPAVDESAPPHDPSRPPRRHALRDARPRLRRHVPRLREGPGGAADRAARGARRAVLDLRRPELPAREAAR